jgi:hypothetical protein
MAETTKPQSKDGPETKAPQGAMPKMQAQPTGEKGTTTSSKPTEQENIYRKGRVMPFQTDWVDEVKEYYKHFSKWADLNEQQRKDFGQMINKVDETSSMKDAIELWKKVNLIWLEKTDTIKSTLKPDLLERTENVATAQDAMNIARESLAHHVNHYLPEFISLFRPNFKDAPEKMEKLFLLIKENEQITAGYELPDSKKDMSPEDIVKSNRKEIEEIINGASQDMKVPQLNKRFNLVNFYNNYNLMNDILTENTMKPASERDYSGNDIMWAYLHRFAMSAFTNRFLSEREEKGITAPPPPQEALETKIKAPPPPPTTENKEITVQPPPQEILQENIKAPPPPPTTENA